MSITAERYAHAVNSKNLGYCPRTITDADVLTAYGWSKPALGALLERLRNEWDGSPIRKDKLDPLMFLLHLRSYPEVLHMLEVWALRVNLENRNEVVPMAVERWLNNLCQKCDGVGAVLLGGKKKIDCRKCKGLRTRPEPQDPNLRRVLNFMDECCLVAGIKAGRALYN